MQSQLLLAVFQYFLLSIILLVSPSTCSIRDSAECRQVKCENPPKNAKCSEVDPSNRDIPQPSGPKMGCCPLWKCKKDEKDTKFFTFHGLNGVGPTIDGKETVHYESAEQMGRSVTSTANGGHDSTAQAANADEMEELRKALEEAGIS